MPISRTDRPEQDLIDRAIRGDAEAFGELYDFYLGPIFAFIRFQVTETADAEDLTEIVFLRAFEKLPEFRRGKDMENFRAWLYRIARNLVIDHYRKKLPARLHEDLPLPSEDQPLERQVQAGEESEQVHRALERLEGMVREVILLRYFSGLSAAETGAILGIRENHVRVIQFRALRRLREFLSEDRRTP